MLYWIWNIIRGWLPFWILVLLYRKKKSLPIALTLDNGNKYRLIMITHDFGMVMSTTKYDPRRLYALKDKMEAIRKLEQELVDEINTLSFEQKETIASHQVLNEVDNNEA